MPKPIYQHDIDRYQDDIKKHGVTGAIRVYTELQEKGHGYAGWAKGVAEASGINTGGLGGTPAGRAAVLFMKNTSGRDFSKAELDGIRIDMAQAYLDVLQGNVELGLNQTEITFKQMRDFHQQVFEKHHLSIDNWTLETPMKLIGRYQGEAAQERTWQELAETQGGFLSSAPFNLMLVSQVREYARGYIYVDSQGTVVPHAAVEGNAEQLKRVTRRNVEEPDRQQARQWLDKVDVIKPLLMSENEREQQYRFAQADMSKPAPRIEDLPAAAQKLFHAAERRIAAYHEQHGLPMDEEKMRNAAMSLASLGYSKTMGRGDAPLMFNIKDGQYLIGERNPGLILAAMDVNHADTVPFEESIERIQQTAQRFEYEEQQRQMAQSQSYGRSFS